MLLCNFFADEHSPLPESMKPSASDEYPSSVDDPFESELSD